MHDWKFELVFRRPGNEDEIVSMSGDADDFHSGAHLQRNGVDWIITKDDGPPQHFDEHHARLICEPYDDAERD